MKALKQLLVAMAAVVLIAAPTLAADAIATGTVKGINAEKKEFVLTDHAGKDWTIKLGDDVLINRGGKESQSTLKEGDPVDVCYHKGVLTWSAHYVLVREGTTEDCDLVAGTIKHYDAEKKEVTFTDHLGKDWAFPLSDAKVRLNREDCKIENVKIGDNALALVDKVGAGPTLRCLMIERK